MSSSTRISQLASIISEKTAVVDSYFKRNNIPAPSFDVDGPLRVQIPLAEKAVAQAHSTVVDATRELHELMLGPTAMLQALNELVSLQAIYRYNIALAFPVNEEVSFEDLSKACGLNVLDLTRILRYAMTLHVFCEPRAGVVAHTAASRLLAEDPWMRDVMGLKCEERFPGAARTVDALVKYGPDQYDTEHSGWTLGHNTQRGFYEELRRDPARNRRFAGAMNSYATKLPLDPLVAAIDWACLGKATVVDVGGGLAAVSIGLTQRFPDLKFVVQDLPDVVAEGPSHVPAELADRVEFMAYSMVDEQPVRGAEVYFWRAVFHNWPDKDCVRFLRNQVSALKTGARLIINEPSMPEPGTTSRFQEKRRRSMDLTMLSLFGSRERDVDDWLSILREADSRFELKSATSIDSMYSSVYDISWNG